MKKAHLTLLVLACAALPGCKPEGERATPAPRVRPVLSVVVQKEVAAHSAFAGTIEPRYASTLAFRVVGRITARDASVGDRIKKGARLAALDPVPYDLAVSDARAGLSDATAKLANAEAQEKRLRILLEGNHVPPQQFEAAQQAREAAAAAVIRAGSALDKALEQRGYTELRAEFDGIVTAVHTEVNQVATAGQPVVTIARPDVREAVIDVPDDVAAGLKEGSSFQVALQIAPSQRIDGRVREIAPRIDALTRSRRVKIALDDPPDDFRLGTTITAHAAASSAGAIGIPATALLERDGKQHVWIVDPDSKTVNLREVTVAARTGESATVSGGLRPGDRVVTAGVHSLAVRQSVKISGEASQ
ncbi:efflux RND transporter periplasmic adaptor subunit [Rhodoplanes azumiensis]|uniref:Efflux RND transporter periplasmic adaptor subunit n=1 Tax=Rhodoplanes azumiensis TaxID=1897628 RepID=A0ABW5AQV5_9BRAD